MMFAKTVTFEFEGKQYEIRAASIDGTVSVRAFLDGRRVSGYTYNVDETTNFDIKRQLGLSAIDHLLKLAEADVRNKQWDSYVTAVQESKKNT